MTDYTEWPYKEAERIVERLNRLGKKNVVVETGYGPSGLPHIGTFGEVARTSFVLQALRTVAPEIDRHLIAFSDDMDGLREAPSNIPNRELVIPHLGKPLTAVPDPFGEEPSYAHYMNRRLREFLDSFGFVYEFRSSTDQYRSGVFNEALGRVMDNYAAVKAMFVKTIAEEKREAWSPFFPICQSCGKIYSTRVVGYDAAARTVDYVCDTGADGKYAPCGHRGATSVLNGAAKVGWKVDWALRWYALGVDYEMHGEDLTESGRLSARIAKTLGADPPELFKYELFLDEEGRKISKKIGNGMSLDQWLSYGPVDSLLYFMYDKPQKPKKMGLPIFPKIVDEYLTLIAGYEAAEKNHPGYFIVSQAKGAHADTGDGTVVTYSLIYNLLIALAEPDRDIIRGYLLRYQPHIEANMGYYDAMIDQTIRYYTEVYLPNKTEEAPDRELDGAVARFLTALEATGDDADADGLQNIVFTVAKENEIKPKAWFTNLYRLFLGQSSGPKIGSFITLLGREKAMERLRAHLAGANNHG
jgi:lysyl-tRNA synthetase class 1